jgi:hypothetical protein
MAIILARDGMGQTAPAALATLSCRPACDLGECWNAKVGHCPAADDLVDLAPPWAGPGRELSNAVVAAAAELSALLHEPAPQPERADASGA